MMQLTEPGQAVHPTETARKVSPATMHAAAKPSGSIITALRQARQSLSYPPSLGDEFSLGMNTDCLPHSDITMLVMYIATM